MKPARKKYIFVPNVLKEERMFYFRYPRLGCYVCYPIKYKHYLLENSFDKGIVDYKDHVKAKEDLEKEYQEKLG